MIKYVNVAEGNVASEECGYRETGKSPVTFRENANCRSHKVSRSFCSSSIASTEPNSLHCKHTYYISSRWLKMHKLRGIASHVTNVRNL